MTQFCISGQGDVSAAMRKCPFLHNIAQTHGPEFASSLACKPSCHNGQEVAHRPLLAEDYDGGDFSSTFALFHGRGGVLPLKQALAPEPKVLYPLDQPAVAAEARCPFSSGTPASDAPAFVAPLFTAAPLASMSMSWGSNWFNIHHLFRKHLNQRRAQERKPPQQSQQKPRGSNLHGGVGGPGLGGPGASGTQSASTSSGGKCPLRRALGPLAGVVFNKQGHLSCPEPIVKMRAALAATRPVRELRPQALPIKLMAVAMTTAMLNVPCGMWREHTEKFSSQWFIAVHATIPFIAMLRKAVIMPKYAILFTICAAIAGQAMGARLERRRLLAQAKDELGGLARTSVVVASRPALVTKHAPGRQPTALPVASLLLSAQQQPLDRAAASSMPAATAHAPTFWLGVFSGAEGDSGYGEASVAATSDAVTGMGLRPHRKEQQKAQFRMRARDDRRAGTRRDDVSVSGRLLVTRDVLAAVPVAAMVPAVTC